MKLDTIKPLAEKKGISLVKLAKDAGTTEATLHRNIRQNKIDAGLLEMIAITLKEPINIFFDTEKEEIEYNSPESLRKKTEEPKIATDNCQDCISKQKEIDALRETLDAKEEILELLRGKRENQSPTGT